MASTFPNITSVPKYTIDIQKSIPYPQPSFQCYATLAAPNPHSNREKVIICPPSRSNYCIKEVIPITRRNQCGKLSTQYPWDEWDVKLGQCVYRKCSATCPSLTTLVPTMAAITSTSMQPSISTSDLDWNTSEGFIRTFKGDDGLEYERETFCCSDNLCNTGTKLSISFLCVCVCMVFIIYYVSII